MLDRPQEPGSLPPAEALARQQTIERIGNHNVLLAQDVIAGHAEAFHGTTASALLPILEHGILPIEAQTAMDILALVGERTPGTEHASFFVDISNLSAIERYISPKPVTLDTIEEQRNNAWRALVAIQANKAMPSDTLNWYRNAVERISTNLDQQQRYLYDVPNGKAEQLQRDLTMAGFPVVFGCSVQGLEDQIYIPHSGITGDRAVIGGIPLINIRLLCVPEQNLPETLVAIELTKSSIAVYPLEDILLNS